MKNKVPEELLDGFIHRMKLRHGFREPLRINYCYWIEEGTHLFINLRNKKIFKEQGWPTPDMEIEFSESLEWIKFATEIGMKDWVGKL